MITLHSSIKLLKNVEIVCIYCKIYNREGLKVSHMTD